MDCRPPMKVLLLTNLLSTSAIGGRVQLCRLNRDALGDICGERLVLFEVPQDRLRGLVPVMNAFRGHIDGVNSDVITGLLDAIRAENVVKIFVDGSNLGEAVKAVKQTLPQIEISTFFHNVESRFFFGSLRQNMTLHALAVLMANYFAERKAVRYSDKIICLSERDSQLLGKVYGRNATHIAPMAVQDALSAPQDQVPGRVYEKYALFVGGGFYANRTGIAWFVKHVTPRIDIKVCIVGRGLEDLRPHLESAGKVEVVGAVESLAEWYQNAQFVIAPIFDGSGMKTKVAEALMYGKKIIGTPEAFSGYEDIVDRAGWMCTTTDEFIASINRAQREILQSFDPELRTVYEEKYSYSAARSRLAEILR
jgi:polysaccharide biosynthesis protein PslH